MVRTRDTIPFSCVVELLPLGIFMSSVFPGTHASYLHDVMIRHAIAHLHLSSTYLALDSTGIDLMNRVVSKS